MLKFDTGRIKPIERENTSHFVLSQLQFVLVIIFLLPLVVFFLLILIVFICRLRRVPHRILDKTHDVQANNHALDILKMLVSMSYMALYNFQI